MIDYEFVYAFSKQILNLDGSIRWVGIANKFGVLVSVEQRQDLQPLLSEEENEDYASATVTRQKTRTKFEPKIGKLVYAAARYQKLNRATIPINDDYYLLISLDVELKNFDALIMEKVIPLMMKEKTRFKDNDKDKDHQIN
jgi:hypothetical protein